ncbi:MAG: DUF924 domain-containing protein [Burkholderiales bacterium]|nr:DUF924 domain-containing protein [Burkholderiales bacterium]
MILAASSSPLPAPAATPEDVLRFWFGAPDAAGVLPRRPEWFRKDALFDEAIRSRFGELHRQARAGHIDAWRQAPVSALAFVIVTDQFPRNLYRGSPDTYSTDGMALDCARMMVERGWDMELAPIQRWFVYLPYEHSESLNDQRECLRLFERVAVEPRLADVPEWAVKHMVVIERFGRFPHRNAILGRPSKPEEIEFLKEPGSSF